MKAMNRKTGPYWAKVTKGSRWVIAHWWNLDGGKWVIGYWSCFDADLFKIDEQMITRKP